MSTLINTNNKFDHNYKMYQINRRATHRLTMFLNNMDNSFQEINKLKDSHLLNITDTILNDKALQDEVIEYETLQHYFSK